MTLLKTATKLCQSLSQEWPQLLVSLALAASFLPPTVQAAAAEDPAATRQPRVAPAASSEPAASWYLPPADQKPRSDLLVPTVSFIVPGFGQWLNGQWGSASAYSGGALAGLLYANHVTQRDHLEHQHEVMRQRARDHDVDEGNALADKDIAERKAAFGSQIYQGAGGLSLYHSFRTAVATRRPGGEYSFLAAEETPMDLLAAPFHFSYLQRPTTYLPLLAGAAIAGLVASGGSGKDRVRSAYTGADAFFTAGFSFNAGTHEEAIFRGWLMPVFHEYGANDTWSNVFQAVLFAAAHLNNVATPLPQLLLGYDLGYVAQKNHWTLSEGVFIHAWWDVMAFWSQYQYTWKYAGKGQARLPPPVLWAPPLAWQF